MATQNSIISYTPQPYFVDGSCTIVGYDNVDTIENDEGVFNPDLSNFTTVNVTIDANDFAFQIDFDKRSDYLVTSDMTLGLIGCSLLTYEDDGGGAPDLDTEFSENITCYLSSDIAAVTDELASFAHNSQNSVHTFCRQPLPSIISGGQANVMFNGLGASSANGSATVYATIARNSADVLARPHAVFIVGHLFIGVDIPITINPQSFSWTIRPENERFTARDFGAINSDGTLVRRSTGEIVKIDNYLLTGSEITAIASEVESSLVPNFFDLIKVNTSYPLLFNPYPVPGVTTAALTVGQLNLTARENFFSIYGFLEDPLDIQTDEYRDGLASEYRARFRIQETR